MKTSKIGRSRYHSPLAGLDVLDGSVVLLVVAGGLDVAVIIRGMGREVSLRGLDFSACLRGVKVDLGAIHVGSSDGFAVVVRGTRGVSVSSSDANSWGLEGDIGGVDLHAGTVGVDTDCGAVHASSTTERAGGEGCSVDVKVLLGALGLEGTLGGVRVVGNRRLFVLEGSVLVVGAIASDL
jgi:hypothetical protein